jgi:hypothetical protein
MKSNKYVCLLLGATMMLSATSCNKDKFLDVNISPNSPTAVTLPVLLTGIIATTGFMATNDYGRATSLITQQYAGINNQPASYDVYVLRGSFDNQWNFELYGGSLINSKLLIDQATTQGSPAYAGIGKLLKAYNFAVATDLYGDIPYSQALQGTTNSHPRYDKQQDIYKGNSSLGIQGLIDLVKEGLADLDKTSTIKPGTADDLVYGKASNNIAQWKKMGNTLLLKLANTISVKEPALAASIINQAAAGAFTSNADDFEVPFGAAVGNTNPLYNYNFVTRPDDQMLSQTILDVMNKQNDPRLPIYFTTTQAITATANTTGTVTKFGTFTGYANGSNAPVPARVPVPANTALTNRSRYNTFVRGVAGEAPARLLTNAQRLFILAESALNLTGITVAGTAQSFYQDAITASMTKAGVSTTDIAAYFAANPQVATLSSDKQTALQQIITQKWIASIGNGLEPYNDARRTNALPLAPVINASGDDNKFPQNFPYPLSELSANAGAENQNAARRTSETVWWATK